MEERQKQQLALKYLQVYHPLLALRVATRSAGRPLGGLGDFWTDLKTSILGPQANNPQAQTAANDVQNSADAGAAPSANSGGILSSLVGPSTATALYNIYRIQKGQPPVQIADVAGVSSTTSGINFLPWAIGAAIILFGISLVM